MGAGNPYAPPPKYLASVSPGTNATISRGKGSVANPNFVPAAGGRTGGKDGGGLDPRAQLADNQDYVGCRNDGGIIRTSTLNPEWVAWNARQQANANAVSSAAQVQQPVNTALTKAISLERAQDARSSGGRRRFGTSSQGLFNTQSGGRKTLLGQ